MRDSRYNLIQMIVTVSLVDKTINRGYMHWNLWYMKTAFMKLVLVYKDYHDGHN